MGYSCTLIREHIRVISVWFRTLVVLSRSDPSLSWTFSTETSYFAGLPYSKCFTLCYKVEDPVITMLVNPRRLRVPIPKIQSMPCCFFNLSKFSCRSARSSFDFAIFSG